MSSDQKIYLGGQWLDRPQKLTVVNPFDDSVVATVSVASAEDYTEAIRLADQAFTQTQELPSYKREAACLAIAEGITKNREKFAMTMSRELGKAIKDCTIEVNRAIGVFKTAAEEAKRIGGDIIDLDWAVGAEERLGLVRRFPRGVIAAITPFNFPLNLVAHKIAPAIASGNSIVVKPASKTPLSALLLAELIDQTEYPKGAISVLPGSSKDASPLITDEHVKLITFTGSSEVGWWIKEHAGKKPVILELGGNAGVIIADDADLEFAATRLVVGAFGVAGQSCISVQRVFVHASIFDTFMTKFTARINQLKIGDPLDTQTDIGTMVDQTSVHNAMQLITDAVKANAKIITGGKISGRTLEPTVLTNVERTLDICRKEAFAPLVIFGRYTNFTDAVAMLNDSEFGLQAGLFTNRMTDIMYAFKHIDCGGVVINDVPTWRADHQPYGGMKGSGIGREGVKYAIEDMTEIKILSMNTKR
jgi:glyceraldehyde-3-phosphate dehydrogenase (NADP+)